MSPVVNKLRTRLELSRMIYVLFFMISGCLCDIPNLFQYRGNMQNTQLPSPVQYSYNNNNAGRLPGNIDRHQSESVYAAGYNQGPYSYDNSNYNMRNVDYSSNNNGFYSAQRNFQDPGAVDYETQKHHYLWNKIAREHQQIGLDRQYPTQETEAVRAATQNHHYLYNNIAREHQQIGLDRQQPTQETEAVRAATQNHHYLYNKIAREHQQIGLDRNANRGYSGCYSCYQ